MQPLWIMIAGPCARGGAERAGHMRTLNEAAVAVFRLGHLPVIGVNLALPMIDAAGGAYDEIMLPVSLELAERCDACLRIEGPSRGADLEVERFRQLGRPVYTRLEDVPRGE
jgi:hypothetical protein